MSLVTRLDTLYSLPLLQQMPFYLYISPENITSVVSICDVFWQCIVLHL